MSSQTNLHRGLLAALLLAAAGCGSPSVTMSTRRAETVQPAVSAGSIFVISHVSRADVSWGAPFAQHIKALLDRAGVRNAVQTRDPLAVQDDRAAYADEMTKFTPDSWLIVEPSDATVDRDGKNLSRRFEAGLYRRGPDGGRRLLVWRASVLLEPSAGYITTADMDELATQLVRKLRQDGFIGATHSVKPASGGHAVDGNLKQE